MVTDKTRREAFITQNLGLVHACAGRFRGRGMEYDDLYSAGCVHRNQQRRRKYV